MSTENQVCANGAENPAAAGLHTRSSGPGLCLISSRARGTCWTFHQRRLPSPTARHHDVFTSRL